MAKAYFLGITRVLSIPKGGESLPTAWACWGHLYDSEALGQLVLWPWQYCTRPGSIRWVVTHHGELGV